MRFTRAQRYEPLTFSDRKAQAYQRRLLRQQAALPLFAEQIAEQQHDWQSEQERRRHFARLAEQRHRDFDARVWREARREHFALPADLRAACMAEWRAWTGPLHGRSLLYIVSKYNGRQEERRQRHREEQHAMHQRLQAVTAAQMELLTP